MKLIQCPTCHKTIEWSSKYPHRPFCCERCRIIDLGAWADGSYAIPTQESPDEKTKGEGEENPNGDMQGNKES